MSSKRIEAKEFLETLYSRYFKDHDGNVELRLIGPKVNSRFFRKGEISEADWAVIVETNTDNHIYFGVNPRSLSQAKKQEDILDIVCLWADVDGKDFEKGKSEALKSVEAFPIPPTIIVDSGHGYHLYWVLAEPIIDLKDEARAAFKQILAGIAKRLGADRSKFHLDSCLRLPGTLNIKNEEQIECCVVKHDKGLTYGLKAFAEFADTEYDEPKEADEPLPEFGSKTQAISLQNAEAARADIEALEVSPKIKKLILTGALLKTDVGDKTRSGRDMSIICSLIANDYDYSTIRSVFFNPFLGCSKRIMETGENALQWDVRKGLAYIEKNKGKESPQARHISEIKQEKGTAEQKRKAMLRFIMDDLLTNEDNPAGRGFKNIEQEAHYFFDNQEKILMNVESTDFYTYTRNRYGISERDFREIRAEFMTVIDWRVREKVSPHRFAYWNPQKRVLYVSNHDNGIYRLDGEKIELCDNGVDGVFFEYDLALTPYTYDPKQEVVDYFNKPARPKYFEAAAGHGTVKIEYTARKNQGLSLETFNQDKSLLKKFLVDRASFTEDEDNPLTPSEQKLLLIVLFYSLFFESIMRDKPIACFIGLKESGKSFIATSIGKIFFGDRFESCHEPGSVEDLKIVLLKNHYIVFDNLDKYISADAMNVLCVAATGGIIEKRKLYKDTEVIRATPHCFLAITSREPKFKRDDFVSRLLLFSTKKIDSPIPRAHLFRTLLENRSAIMTEVLTNLNSIVKILQTEEDLRNRQGANCPPPRCISRVADWEYFGRMICGFEYKFLFRLLMQKMNEKKDRFAIEDDYIYLILHCILYQQKELLRRLSPQQLYHALWMAADQMKLKDFERKYKSAPAVSQHIANIRLELEREMIVETYDHANRRREYSFKAFGDTRDDNGKEPEPDETKGQTEEDGGKGIDADPGEEKEQAGEEKEQG